LQKAYCGLYYKEGDFPVAEKVAKDILSLPMYPGLGYSQQSKVAERVLDFISARQPGSHALVASSA
jgi:dTDP-4-amino-4,6-dideoxygalactose transaminase